MENADTLIEPTDEERANGWTAKTLTSYIRNRQQAQEGVVSFDPTHRPPKRPTVANSKYNPHRCWGDQI